VIARRELFVIRPKLEELVDVKRDLRRNRAKPTLESLESALREFLHRAGEPSPLRPVTPLDFHEAMPPRSQLGDAALRVMIARYNRIVRFIDRDLVIEWPSEGVSAAVAIRFDWSLSASVASRAAGWTPNKVQRSLDCVARATVLLRSVEADTKH
jgi:hypothetical protein